MRQEWLEDILAVLEAGSVTAAAERRFVTRSAFTRRLRLIEKSLGAELFDRTRKPVRPLPHVAERVAEMRGLVTRLRALRSALTDPVGRSGRRVSIACQHTIATTNLPRLICELAKEGRVNVRVRECDRATCLMRLLTGKADLGIEAISKSATSGRMRASD